MVIGRKEAKLIEWYLSKYTTLKRICESRREDIIHASIRLDNTGGARGGYSDITASKAIKLLDKSEEDIWLRIIEKTIKKYDGTDLGKFLEKKYFQGNTMITSMIDLHIEKTTAYRWREEIITYMALLAIQEGLIRI